MSYENFPRITCISIKLKPDLLCTLKFEGFWSKLELSLNETKLFPKRQILESSKLKDLADHNFNFDESDRKFSKWEENAVVKGEIARYDQFLLFPQCFEKTYNTDTENPEYVWERVNIPTSALTEIIISYSDRHMAKLTDRKADSSIALETFV